MPSPTMASDSRSSSNTSRNKPTVKSWRGATIKLPFNPDLPSASRRKQQPRPPTDAPSSSVEAAASHHSTMSAHSTGGGVTKFTSDLDSTLSSLPLYDGGLYERFGHDVYVRAEKSGGEAPSYYMRHKKCACLLFVLAVLAFELMTRFVLACLSS